MDKWYKDVRTGSMGGVYADNLVKYMAEIIQLSGTDIIDQVFSKFVIVVDLSAGLS